jgi:hypothetical protein
MSGTRESVIETSFIVIILGKELVDFFSVNNLPKVMRVSTGNVIIKKFFKQFF